MVNLNRIPKGLQVVLEERNDWPAAGCSKVCLLGFYGRFAVTLEFSG